MKTAISIPDDLFEAADQLAKGIGVSRSQLYTRAVENFVRENGHGDVTERINRVLERTNSELDPFWVAAQARVLREDW